MGKIFEEQLREYARLGLIHGLGFGQRARPLYIDSYQTEDHGHFIPILAEEAYKLGAETVDVRYRYPELERAMFLRAPEEFKLYEPKWVTVRAQEIVDRNGGRIALNGNGRIGVMDDVDPKYPSGFQSAYFLANEPLTTRRMKMLQPWTILDVPTIAWASKLGMTTADLWEFLFTVSGAQSEDPIGYATSVNKALHKRCRILNSLRIRTLHFLGDGTDLKVRLSPQAMWLGGSKQSEDGVWFEANWPSFEVYTTPDWRGTEGYVSITMPSVISGPIVEGLRVWFSGGRVSHFTARSGGEAFEALITHDEGASQVGEIALVGLDSPLAQYEQPHFCGMLDENKRCHLAFGEAYPAALNGGITASKEELALLGSNVSDVHHDMMISDRTTSVTAYDEFGDIVARLMENGRWVGKLV